MNQRGWLVVFRALFVVFLGTAALNMLHVRGGFLTNHAADLVVPAWLYVAFRGLYSVHGRRTLLQRTLGRNPELTALSLFIASALTEIGQFYWPRGVFRNGRPRFAGANSIDPGGHSTGNRARDTFGICQTPCARPSLLHWERNTK